jgi:hypothetical protein
MLTFLIHPKTAWGDYFTGSPTKIQSKEYGASQPLSDSSVHVSNCLFRTITSTSNGGALSCSSSVTYLLIESTSFFSCKTSGYGGAIYFVNTNSGQCVLYEVCGNDCCTTSNTYGQFNCIELGNTASSKNYVNYSSIARCVNENSNTYHTLRHCYGINYCPSINVSMNKCYYRSGIYSIPYSNSNSVTCSLSYSTFTDNSATHSICIMLYTTGAKYEIKSCNILRNTQVSLGSGGTIRSDGDTTIKDSCILENTATYVLFQGSSYTITLSNCIVDSTSKSGNVVTQSTVTKSFILALNHISTRNCHAQYDSVGTLTAILSVSPPINKSLCYSWRMCNCQARISDFFSLSTVLIVTFIHSNSS